MAQIWHSKMLISLDSLRAQSCLLVAKENKKKNRVFAQNHCLLEPEGRGSEALIKCSLT